MSNTLMLEPNPPLASTGADDVLYEVVNGERRELEPMGALQAVLASVIAEFVAPFARRKRLGLGLTETLFVLRSQPRLERRPDVAFVSYDRWPGRTIPETNAWDVVPNLAVEVVSPTNSAEEIDIKVTEYFAAGVELVWVVYPKTQRIYVFTGVKDVAILDRGDVLDGGRVLPEFQLPIAELFDAVMKPE